MDIVQKLNKIITLQSRRFCTNCRKYCTDGFCEICQSDDLAIEFKGESSWDLSDFYDDVLHEVPAYPRSKIKSVVDEKIKAFLPRTNGHIDLGETAYDLDELVRRAYPDDYGYMTDNEESRMLESGVIFEMSGVIYDSSVLNEYLDKLLDSLTGKAA